MYTWSKLFYIFSFGYYSSNAKDNATHSAKVDLFRTTRDRKRKFEVPKRLPVLKDLYGHPVLNRDVGHVGSVLSPHMVGFLKSSQLWKKKRTNLLLLCITVLLTPTNTSSHVRLRSGGSVSLQSHLLWTTDQPRGSHRRNCHRDVSVRWESLFVEVRFGLSKPNQDGPQETIGTRFFSVSATNCFFREIPGTVVNGTKDRK